MLFISFYTSNDVNNKSECKQYSLAPFFTCNQDVNQDKLRQPMKKMTCLTFPSKSLPLFLSSGSNE